TTLRRVRTCWPRRAICSQWSKAERSRSRSTRPMRCATRRRRIAISKTARRRGKRCLPFSAPRRGDTKWDGRVSTRPFYFLRRARLCVHGIEELGIVLRILELVDQKLEAIDGAHRHQHAAQYPHLREN